MALTSPVAADGESLRSHAFGVRWPLLLQAPERPRIADPVVVDDAPTPAQFTWRVILGAKKFTLPGGGLLILSNIAAAALPVIAGTAVDRGIAAGDLGQLLLWTIVLALDVGVMSSPSASAHVWAFSVCRPCNTGYACRSPNDYCTRQE